MNRSVKLGLFIIVGIIIYAYGFSVTQVNLEELGLLARQQALTRILRALAHPDVIEFDQAEVEAQVPIYVPCPADGAPEAPPTDTSGPYLTVVPPCADPKTEVLVEGYNLLPNADGPLNFIPPSGVSIQLDRIETDGAGFFSMMVELRNRSSDEVQHLRAITRKSEGLPRLSQNGKDTIDKIIETVFMAFLATTIGTILAIPVSFFAARNLMSTVTSPVSSVALSIIFVPIGLWLGAQIAGAMARSPGMWNENLMGTAVALLLSFVVGLLALRLVVPPEEEGDEPAPSRTSSTLRVLAGLVAALSLLFGLFMASKLTILFGIWLAAFLGVFDFVGYFIADLGGILYLILPFMAALIAGGVMGALAGRFGQTLVDHVSPTTGKIMNLVLGALAGAVLFVLIGLFVAWLYKLTAVRYVVVWPAIIGGIIGAYMAARRQYNASLNIGLAIYTVTRTILNALRSVEALIMVIVFAVWVGIGPFAGVLALGLHTVAALAKLYSEQVEGIAEGPLEAVSATGANRLQTIVYAVVPQIVPPYISFTMYRWDINVRMSTIIGFAGGGGIGFLLQQNINLLNYRAASAQIVAIAVVVSLMDYLSSILRRRTL
jgi:phosphonate ABC transporter permease subunit PhnE